METVLDRSQADWKPVAIGLAGVLALVALANSGVVGGETELRVAANAPKQGDSLFVLVAVNRGLTGACEGTAEVEVFYNDILVYPGVFNKVEMSGCEGTIEIPYHKFADRNGQYLVKAHFDGRTAETRVFVEKVVNWVYIRSFPEPDHRRVRVDAAFDRLKDQPLTSSVFASGTLVLDITWERCSDTGPLGLPITDPTQPCQADKDLVFHAEIPVDSRASTHVFIPWNAMDSPKWDGEEPEEGWYNVTATFHNDEAKGNYNVPQDPSVYQEDPPGNWFEVEYG